MAEEAEKEYDHYRMSYHDSGVAVPKGTEPYSPCEGCNIVGFKLPDGSIIRPVIYWEIESKNESYQDLDEVAMANQYDVHSGDDVEREFEAQ